MTVKKKREPNLLKEMIKDHLAEGKHPQELLEEGGLLQHLTKQLVQLCLEAEMDTHLGYEKGERNGTSSENRRNGYSKKTLKSEQGVCRGPFCSGKHIKQQRISPCSKIESVLQSVRN